MNETGISYPGFLKNPANRGYVKEKPSFVYLSLGFADASRLAEPFVSRELGRDTYFGPEGGGVHLPQVGSLLFIVFSDERIAARSVASHVTMALETVFLEQTITFLDGTDHSAARIRQRIRTVLA